MHNFKELRIWNNSMEIAKMIFPKTRKFPKEEIFGLKIQINKCLVSIPSNIAEGAGRNSNKDFRHFIGIALGSSFELETQLILAGDYNYIPSDELEIILGKVVILQRMINKFRTTLK